MSLNTADLFDQPEYSDVVIKFGDRQVQCHKIILCTNSEYFKKLCGPGSHFAESKQNVIELKEDDPDAVHSMLLYLYTQRDDNGQDADWALQLEIKKTAEKYLVPVLATIAGVKFRIHASKVTDPQKVFDAIMHIRQHAYDAEDRAVADGLEKKHKLALLKVDDFRRFISQDQSLMWKYLDEFTDFFADIPEVRLARCECCRTQKVFSAEDDVGHHCSYEWRDYQTWSCWAPKNTADWLRKYCTYHR